MATNLRLSEYAAAAVKAEAQRTGRSQQDVIRAAVDAYLTPPDSRPAEGRDGPVPRAIREATIPPELPFMTVPDEDLLPMPDGLTSLDLLDREDRV
ncbi:MAG: ribbon-helix-helix protein, CopG family [Solirubrobacterales bacterium]